MKFVRAWAPACILMIIIFFLSSRPSTRVSDTFVLNFLFFKTLHVIEYGALYILMVRGVSFHRNQKREGSGYALAFLLTMLYAISDELHQKFVPTREGNILRDGIIDALGATLAWLFLLYITPKLPKKPRRWVGRLLTR